MSTVAGKRAGLAGERSGLYMEQIRIIREMRKATNNTYPKFMLWENVPGALSSNKGDDFRAVLEEAARCAENGVSIPQPKKWSTVGCIVGDGWSIAWRTIDAQYFGVPQRRRRIFLVADFGSERAGEILFKPEGLRRNSTKSGETWKGFAAHAERGVDGGGRDGCLTPWDVQSRRVFEVDGAWPALYSGEGGGHGYALIRNEKNVKCLNPHDAQSQRIYDASGIYPCLSSNETGGQNRQAICLQANGIDRKDENGCNGKDWTEGVSYTLNTIDRHAVAYGVDCRNAVLDEEQTHTLQAHSSGGTSLNCTPSVCYASTGYGKFIKGRPTLRASGGDCGGGSEALIMATGQANAEIAHGISTTLLAESHEQPICVHPHVCGTIAASGAGTSRPAGQCNETDLCIVTNSQKHRKYIIRRLTPLECESLQGFPKNWTQVEYKNKPMSDSARYRMCGNSVAIPCVVRVLGGIAEIQNKNV